jgi:hypothetical protein
MRSTQNQLSKTLNSTMQETEKTLPGIDVLNTGFGDFELRFDPDKLLY